MRLERAHLHEGLPAENALVVPDVKVDLHVKHQGLPVLECLAADVTHVIAEI